MICRTCQERLPKGEGRCPRCEFPTEADRDVQREYATAATRPGGVAPVAPLGGPKPWALSVTDYRFLRSLRISGA